MIAMSRCAWLATFAIGCGHPSTPVNPGRGSAAPTPAADAAVDASVALENDLPLLAERAVKLYLDWQTALTEAGTDCVAAATKLNAIADANADVIAANQRLLHGDRERIVALRTELDKHQAELDASAKAIVESPTMQKCSTDPAFAKALDRLGGEG
jgi:4-aminobutyrate aminotransferase-like enzyme